MKKIKGSKNIIKKVFLILITLILFCIANVYAEDSTSVGWMPKWNVGDWWIVEIYLNSTGDVNEPIAWEGPYKLRYEVKNIMKIESYYGFPNRNIGAECFVIEIEDLDKDILEKNAFFYIETKSLVFKRTEIYYNAIKNYEIKEYNYSTDLEDRPIVKNLGCIYIDFPIFPLKLMKKSYFKKQFKKGIIIGEDITQEVSFIILSDVTSKIDNSYPKNELHKRHKRDDKKKEIIAQVLKKNHINPKNNSEIFKVMLKGKTSNLSTQYWATDAPWSYYDSSSIMKSYLIDHSWRSK